jgi:selenide,water dikinase
VGARVEAAALPLLPGVSDLAAAGFLPGGARRNRDHVASWLDVEDGVPDEALWLMTDPQTSGGLLLAVAPDGLGRLGGALDAGLVPWDVVGELTDGPAGRIAVGA